MKKSSRGLDEPSFRPHNGFMTKTKTWTCRKCGFCQPLIGGVAKVCTSKACTTPKVRRPGDSRPEHRRTLQTLFRIG